MAPEWPTIFLMVEGDVNAIETGYRVITGTGFEKEIKGFKDVWAIVTESWKTVRVVDWEKRELRAELLTKYGEAFKERIFEVAVEEVDCETEGKVYVGKKRESKNEKHDDFKELIGRRK